MTLNEARNSIQEIIEASHDYEASINNLQGQLVAFGDSANSACSSISNEINEKAIIAYADKNAGLINSSLNDVLSLTKNALSTLTTDANRKIREIVDNYNAHNNSLPKEKREEPLSYEEITLSSSGGSIATYSPSIMESTETPNLVDTSADNSVSSSGSAPKVSSGGSAAVAASAYYANNYASNYASGTPNYYNNGEYNNEPNSNNHHVGNENLEEDEMDKYFKLLGTTGVYSKDIDNWDELLNKFLTENELDKTIDKLELDGNVIRCTLLNAKKYKVSNVKNKDKFVEKAKEMFNI